MKPIARSVATIFALLLFTTPMAASSQKAHSFKLPGVKSNVSLQQYRGRVVYLDFWASWCTPCKKSFPWMSEMQQQYKRYGFEVIAVNLDEDRSLADEFLRDTQANFTVAFDPSGKTAEKYGLMVMPTSYLIDRNGNLVAEHKGFRSTDKRKMENEIRELLASK